MKNTNTLKITLLIALFGTSSHFAIFTAHAINSLKTLCGKANKETLKRAISFGIPTCLTGYVTTEFIKAKEEYEKLIATFPSISPSDQTWCKEQLATCNNKKDIAFKLHYFNNNSAGAFWDTILLPPSFRKSNYDAWALRHEYAHIHYGDTGWTGKLMPFFGSFLLMQGAESGIRLLRNPRLPKSVLSACAVGTITGVAKVLGMGGLGIADHRRRESRADQFACEHTTSISELIDAGTFFIMNPEN